MQKLRAELAAAKDRELRVHAELDNYRKRAARELDERLRYANLGLLRDLLPVIDNVERAIEAAEKNADAAALLEGFKMVQPATRRRAARHHCRRSRPCTRRSIRTCTTPSCSSRRKSIRPTPC